MNGDIGGWILLSCFVFMALFAVLLCIHSEFFPFVWATRLGLRWRGFCDKLSMRMEWARSIRRAKILALEREWDRNNNSRQAVSAHPRQRQTRQQPLSGYRLPRHAPPTPSVKPPKQEEEKAVAFPKYRVIR